MSDLRSEGHREAVEPPVRIAERVAAYDVRPPRKRIHALMQGAGRLDGGKGSFETRTSKTGY